MGKAVANFDTGNATKVVVLHVQCMFGSIIRHRKYRQSE